MRRFLVIAVLAVATSTVLAGQGQGRQPAQSLTSSGLSEVRKQPGNSSNRYLVVLRDGVAGTRGPHSRAAAVAQAKARAHNLSRVERVLSHTLTGFVARLTDTEAEALSQDPDVAYVEQDIPMSGGGMALTPVASTVGSWGIDRINQRQLPLDGQYDYSNDGTGVTAYVVDTGVRVTHDEFGGRAVLGPSFVSDDPGNPNPGTSLDCHGHGTHVAGILGGATYGVARGVRIVSVRVLNCAGAGSSVDLISAIDWITYDHQTNFTPAVANLSVTSGVVPPTFTAIEDAIQRSLESGVTWVLIAGNEGGAVADYTPGRHPSAITVGASYAQANTTDMRAPTSNTGPEVDLYAPGVDIVSAYFSGDSVWAQGSGTSTAAPHVAGVVARFLQPNWWAPPAHVYNQVVLENATGGAVHDCGGSTTNRMLFSGFLDGTF
jgi:subtilisin family serine protease